MAPRDHPRVKLGHLCLNALLLFPLHSIVMRLHERDGSRVVILTPDTADLLVLQDEVGLVCGVRHRGAHYRGSHGGKFKEGQKN